METFSQEELTLLEKSEKLLKHSGKDIYSAFTNHKQSLISLAMLVSRTPSLKSRERYGMNRKDIDTMAETLLVSGTSDSLLLPTRTVMGRCFIHSKINFFYFILNVVSGLKTAPLLINDIRNRCSRIVFSMMAEETYEAIIKNRLTDSRVKRAAAEELSYLWEFRMDRNLSSFSPPLMSLWKERCRLVPVLGTLQGTSEILKLSINLPDIWGDFLSSVPDNTDMEAALEEFVFGLRYEEIRHLREIIRSSGLPAIDRKKAAEILRKENSHGKKRTIFLDGDAREIYSFFHFRLENAGKRDVMNADGPRQTIEELFLIYLLKKKRAGFTGVIKNIFTKF